MLEGCQHLLRAECGCHSAWREQGATCNSAWLHWHVGRVWILIATMHRLYILLHRGHLVQSARASFNFTCTVCTQHVVHYLALSNKGSWHRCLQAQQQQQPLIVVLAKLVLLSSTTSCIAFVKLHLVISTFAGLSVHSSSMRFALALSPCELHVSCMSKIMLADAESAATCGTQAHTTRAPGVHHHEGAGWLV